MAEAKQFAVIGIGNFGYYLARHLYKKGHEVLAIDIDPKPIQDMRDVVSQAIVVDAKDRKAMEALSIHKMDAAIICVGSMLSESILIALNLKDIGVASVYAKAANESHTRILHKLGVTEVFFPEKDLAVSLAERLNNPNMLDYLPFLEGYSIVQISPPAHFIGKMLKELDLINRFGVQVVAVKEIVPDRLDLIPTGDFVIKDSDIVIMLGPNDALEKLRDGKL